MFISYAICTHNEGEYIAQLLRKLTSYISAEQIDDAEIVILDDNSTDARTQMILRSYSSELDYIKLAYKKHTGDFSEQKNYLNSLCKGDWIFNLDADEFVTEYFLSYIKELIRLNPDVDAYWVPRVNTVSGITEEHIKKWGWRYSVLEGFYKFEKIDKTSDAFNFLKKNNLIKVEGEDYIAYDPPIIMWPDYQLRLYKNSPEIKWIKPVHEQLVGYKKMADLPEDVHVAIRHFKTIERQEEQNDKYDKYQ